MDNKSPCLTCTKVQDPKNCENKSCKEWREWFIKRWEKLRNGKPPISILNHSSPALAKNESRISRRYIVLQLAMLPFY